MSLHGARPCASTGMAVPSCGRSEKTIRERSPACRHGPHMTGDWRRRVLGRKTQPSSAERVDAGKIVGCHAILESTGGGMETVMKQVTLQEELEDLSPDDLANAGSGYEQESIYL